VLVAVLVPVPILEGIFREELVWRPVSVALGVALVFTLLWRRTHPLLVVAIGFGAFTAVHVVTLIGVDESVELYSAGYVVLLPYSLFRWGTGREAAIGLAIIVVSIAISGSIDATIIGAVIASAFLLALAALGASIRYRASFWLSEMDRVKLRERQQLARELHDTVAHHISAIAIQAQAGRTLAGSHPESAVDALEIIEEAASGALAEMRIMVGVLRGAEEPDLAPQRGVADIEQLVRSSGERPRVDVELSGDLDNLRPSVGAAVYRLAQESITNAVRHARHVTRITVRVVGDDDWVRLTVRDDGDANSTGRGSSGYGLVGMTERAKLLGGTLEAGPSPDEGWTVNAVLPRTGSVT